MDFRGFIYGISKPGFLKTHIGCYYTTLQFVLPEDHLEAHNDCLQLKLFFSLYGVSPEHS